MVLGCIKFFIIFKYCCYFVKINKKNNRKNTFPTKLLVPLFSWELSLLKNNKDNQYNFYLQQTF